MQRGLSWGLRWWPADYAGYRVEEISFLVAVPVGAKEDLTQPDERADEVVGHDVKPNRRAMWLRRASAASIVDSNVPAALALRTLPATSHSRT